MPRGVFPRTPEHRVAISKALKGRTKQYSNRHVPIGSVSVRNGYIIVKVADPNEWEVEHRLVMGLTKGDGLIAHHINGDRIDNRSENLEVLSRMEHYAVHVQDRARELALTSSPGHWLQSWTRRWSTCLSDSLSGALGVSRVPSPSWAAGAEAAFPSSSASPATPI